MLLTALVAAVSLAGLFAPSMPMRSAFAASALLGMGLLAIGHAGFASSPLDDHVRALLDGALAPLRNVHKVDPLVRLPMALGFAHATGLVADRVRSSQGGRAVRLSTRPLSAPLAVCLVVSVLAASAGPLVTGGLRNPGWTAVPAAWQQAGLFLADEGGGTVLVLPASGFGQQRWGWTIDEPVQGVSSTRWVARSQVPLVPGPTIRFLDAIEERVADGVGSLALADTLAGAGVGWVLVRRDLDLSVADTAAPAAVDAAMAASPGLELAASFGSTGLGRQPLIDLYRVVGVPVSAADAPLRASLPSMAGGPEDLVTMREVGLLRPERHTVIGAGVPDLVGDGYRRQERQFGRVHDALSQVMTAQEPYRTSRAAHDYAGVPGQRRVVARYGGAELVTASSSGGYADAFGPIRPEVGPASVVDRDRTTYWQSAPFEDPVGQWVQIEFGHDIAPRGVNVVAGVDTVSGSPVRRVTVEAGGQRQVAGVNPFTGEVRVPLDGSAVRSIRVTVEDVAPGGAFGVVAIREVSVAGRPITRSLVLPDTGAARTTSLVMRAQPARRACYPSALGPTCAPGQARARLEQLQLRRTFVTHQENDVAVRGSVTARSTTEAAALLDPVGDSVTATATSTLSGDLLVSPRFAVDGVSSTPWVAAPADRRPTLRLEWNRLRTLRRIQVATAAGAYARPDLAVLASGGERRTVRLDAGSFGFFEPLRARSVTVEFTRRESGPQPVAIGELRLSGVEDLVRPVRWDAPTGAPCGLGPEVGVDGEVRRTEVHGTVGDLLRGTPLSWRVCDGPVHLEEGRHEIRADATVQYAADRLVLEPLAVPAQAHATRTVRQSSWSAAQQTYDVGPGGEAVLRVAQNVNSGWVAAADGRTLEPVTVDGWQQGFVVPSGKAVSVELSFAPDRWYRLALLVGLLAAVVLIFAALYVVWKGPTVGASCLYPAARPDGHGRRRRSGLWRAAGPVLAVGGASIVSWLVGGPVVALAVLATSAVAARGPQHLRWAPVGGALLVAISGLVAVGFGAGWPGESPVVADLLAAVGIGVLVATVLPLTGSQRAGAWRDARARRG
jgi:arabinofuranan 3-O-arabinosyltransferase